MREDMPVCIFDNIMTSEVYTNILDGFLLPTADTLYSDGMFYNRTMTINTHLNIQSSGSRRKV